MEGDTFTGDDGTSYPEVAGALQALRSEASRPGPAPSARTLAAMVLAARGSDGRLRAATGVAVAIAAAATFLTGGLAAAGALPHAAQHAVARVLSRAGISVPDPTTAPPAPPAPTTSVPTAERPGEEVSGAARSDEERGREKGGEVAETASEGRSLGPEEPGPSSEASVTGTVHGGAAGERGPEAPDVVLAPQGPDITPTRRPPGLPFEEQGGNDR